MRDSLFPSALATLAALARIPLLAALLVAPASALDLTEPFGDFTGDLGQLAPRSLTMTWTVNDPPGALGGGQDNGFFEWKRFDFTPGSSPRGAIQLSIRAERWMKPTPWRKQNFSWTEKRQTAGDGVQIRIDVAAGNVDFLLSMSASGTLVSQAPNAKVLLEEMIALIPRMPVADAGIEVTPRAMQEPAAVGLVPASPLFPARIVALRNAVGRTVTFSIHDAAPAVLEAGKASGKSVEVVADASGKAEVLFRYAPADDAPLPAPLTIPVLVRGDAGGEVRRSDVKVGLGLAFEGIRAVPGAKYAFAKEAPFPMLVSVRSTFHPDLRVAAYLHAAKEAKLWGDAAPGFLLETRWANRPAGAEVEHEAYRGSSEVVASLDGRTDNYLSANIQPWYTVDKAFYPAVILKSQGRHIFEVTGRTAAIDVKTKRSLGRMPNDPLVTSSVLVVLSSEEPESAFQSLACSLNPQTKVQALMLETAKKMPMGYGTAVDYFTAGTGLLCGLLKEEYEASFLELANFLGGKYLDHLETPEVFATLTQKQQDALQLARKAYDKLNDAKQEEDMGELK